MRLILRTVFKLIPLAILSFILLKLSCEHVKTYSEENNNLESEARILRVKIERSEEEIGSAESAQADAPPFKIDGGGKPLCVAQRRADNLRRLTCRSMVYDHGQSQRLFVANYSKVFTLDSLAEMFSTEHCEGGHFVPKDCRSLTRAAIIVPYRARLEHLIGLLYHLHTLLPLQQLDYKIYVTEQAGNGTFNKARLLNIGYLQAKQDYDWHCYIFHDVDLYPISDRNTYTCRIKPTRLISSLVNESYVPLGYSGGVLMMTAQHMTKINGMPGSYWGWGGEDDDIFMRLRMEKLEMRRVPDHLGRFWNHRTFHQGSEPGNEANVCRWKVLDNMESNYKHDGINSLEYRLLSVRDLDLYQHVLVDLLEPLTHEKLEDCYTRSWEAEEKEKEKKTQDDDVEVEEEAEKTGGSEQHMK